MRISLTLIGLLPALVLSADEVYLKNGGKLTGRVTDDGDKITIALKAGGQVTVPKEQVDRIVKTPDAPEPPRPAPAAPAPEFRPFDNLQPLKQTEFSSYPLESIEFVPNRSYVLLRGPNCERLLRARDGSTTSISCSFGKRIYPLKDKLAVLAHSQEIGVFTVEGKPGDPGYLAGLLKPATGPAHIVVSSDSTWVAAFRMNPLEVFVWKIGEYVEPRIIKPATSSKWLAAWSADDKTAVTVHEDGFLRTWDLAKGTAGLERSFSKEGLGRHLWSRDGKVVVVVLSDKILVVDARTLKPPREFVAFVPRAAVCKLSSNGSLLAYRDPSGNSALRVLSLVEGRELGSWSPGSAQGAPPARDFEFSADGKWLVALYPTAGIFVLSLPAVKEAGFTPLAQPAKDAACVGFSPDGGRVLLGRYLDQGNADGLGKGLITLYGRRP